MAASCNTIISRALAKAKVPLYTAQAQAELNIILSELCQNVDLSVARGKIEGNFNPGATTTQNGVTIFGGPIILPADYLRTSGSSGSSGAQKSAYWYNTQQGPQGVPMVMTPFDLAEFDMQVQQAGNQSYPWMWVTDMSVSPPQAFVYPPPSGAYPYVVRYQRQMPDITDFTQPPWFPDTRFLIQELAGRMMEDTDDTRSDKFLGDSEDGSRGILKRYLRLHDDKTNRASTVQVDARNFRIGASPAQSRLPNTKTTGW